MDMIRSKGDNKDETLQQIPLFAGCSKKELVALKALCAGVSLREGRVLACEDDFGRQFVVITDGRARVTRRGLTVGALGRGDYFGQLALVARGVHRETVTAETPVRALVFSKVEFLSLLELSPVVAQALADRAQASLPEREADYLMTRV